MTAFIPRRAARVLAPLALVLLAACSQQELYGQLNERQANEMVAVLRNAGLVAEKSPSRDGKAYVVSTNAHDFSRAVEVLHAGGFPRDSFDTLGQVFKKEGFVSSPTEERARFTHALSQELSHTLSNIDGVVQARVHVSVPDKNPLADKPTPATASGPLSKVVAPCSRAACAAAGTGSKPCTVCPAAMRLAAIGPPMWPSPRNAIVAISVSSLEFSAICARFPALAADFRAQIAQLRAAVEAARPMTTRMISFVPSRMRCTRRSRTIFSNPYSRR